jgi:glucosamine--fructose-6-phosphate aminotransferase (isomerizing)
MTLHAEILEQPVCLGNLLAAQRTQVEEIARAIQGLDIQYVFLAARGTSDNAGRYANYLWGSRNHLPLALATPSLFTYYRQPPSLKGALVVGISQSGQSPDIVSVLAEGRRQGRPTLAITNAPESPLAQAADFVLDIRAGEERAVAATKTYTAELAAIGMLSAAMTGSEDAWRELRQLPTWVEQVLQADGEIEKITRRYQRMKQCVVLGRGYNYATAFEWALKLKELAYVAAEPYSPADFLHGPIAMVESGLPVLAALPSGKVFGSLMELLVRLKNEYRAELVIITNVAGARELAQAPINIPEEVPEWLSPIVAIVPAQLVTYHLTRARGYDTERPRGIHKITETR